MSDEWIAIDRATAEALLPPSAFLGPWDRFEWSPTTGAVCAVTPMVAGGPMRNYFLPGAVEEENA